jgi:hypothetical protein
MEKQRRPRIYHHPKVGTTSIKLRLKADVPRLIENFKPEIVYADAQSKILLSFLSTLVANKAATVTHLTTDNTPILRSPKTSFLSRMGLHLLHQKQESEALVPNSQYRDIVWPVGRLLTSTVTAKK